jgi:hypothetical protein
MTPRRVKALLGLAVVGCLAAGGWYRSTPRTIRRVVDSAGLLSPGVRLKADQYLGHIFDESDVDVRIVLERDGSNDTLEQRAVSLVRALGAGGWGGEKRGLLIVYDADTRRGRIEVGYGLEEYFPDGLVGSFLRRHVEVLFASGNPAQGLHLLLRMVHNRIREAVLDERFDPRVLAVLQDAGNLSGGAGATVDLPLAAKRTRPGFARLDDEQRSRLGSQATPEDAYRAYVSWLEGRRFDPTLELFTPGTRRLLSSFPMTPGYFEDILFGEYGKAYVMLVRDDLAMQVFISSPFVSPHFYARGPNGWQMDIQAEVANTANVAGGEFTWTYRGRNDRYTNRFADELLKIGNYVRLGHGDNRKLPVRNAAAPS